ncbi:NDR1/HIN1-like protein 13 [Linum perenne]
MSANNGRLPVHHQPINKPLERHHTTRYYAHRVKQSLTNRVAKVICAVFLTILLLVGTVAFVMWLSLRPHRPRCFIEDFSIPGLDQPNGFQNAQVRFNVTVRNSNRKMVFHYGAMQGSVFYKDQQIGSAQLTDPFDQEPKSTMILNKVLSGATMTVTSRRWAEVQGDRSLGKVPFRLDITATIMFRVSAWHSENHRMHATCEVSVGSDGSILPMYRTKRCPVYFT